MRIRPSLRGRSASARVPGSLRPIRRYLLGLAVAGLALAGFLALDGSARGDGQTIVLTRTVTAADTGSYLYLPFTMPAGVKRVEVTLTKTTGNAVTGLGLFDQRGPGYGSKGFRGIYGEEFQELFIERGTASPAFVPGPIEKGRWTVIVPVFRGAADRLTVTVKPSRVPSDGGRGARFAGGRGADGRTRGGGTGGGESGGGSGGLTGTGEPGGGVEGDCPEGSTVPRTGDDNERISRQAGWYRGDLHDHTTHSSDSCSSGSARTPSRFAEAVRRSRLDFVSLTDHNVTTQNRSIGEVSAADDVLVMPGLEMTNWFHGHATVTGLEPGDWLDWRQRPRPVPLREHEKLIDAFIAPTERRNFYTSASHPSAGPIAWQFFNEAEARPELLTDGLETWTGPFQPDDDATIERWDEFLNRSVRDKRFRIVANGASDVHGFENDQGFALGAPTTVAYARELSKDAVVDALEAGRSYITCDPDGPGLYLSATAGEGDGPRGNDQRQMVGGTVYGDAATVAKVSVIVRGGKGRVLSIIRDGAGAQTTAITSNEQKVTVLQPVGGGGFVRAELRDRPTIDPTKPRAGETGMHAMTNPIFLERGRVPNGVRQGIVAPPDDDGGTAGCPPQREGEGGEPDGGQTGGDPDGGGAGGGNGGGRTIRGTSRDDVLTGTPGDDKILCGSGNDRVDGGSGDDTIVCGSGNDVIAGGSGNDSIRGESGDDRIDGGPGDDRLQGDSGDDRIEGGPGRDSTSQ